MQATAEVWDNAWGLAQCHFWWGELETIRGRWEIAARHFEQAAAGAEDVDLKLKSTANSAWAWFHAGDPSTAERHFQELVKLAQGHSDALGLAQGYYGMAAVARLRNQEVEAVNWLEKARVEAQRSGAADLIAHISMDLGMLYARGNRLDLAEEQYSRVEAYLQQTPIKSSEAVEFSQGIPLGDERTRLASALRANQALLALRKGQREQARQFAAQAMAMQTSLPGTEQIGNLGVGGAVHFYNADFDVAKRQFLSSFRLAERINNPQGQFESGVPLCYIYMAQGLYEPAYRVCTAVSESLEMVRCEAGDQRARLSYIRDKIRVYEWAVSLALMLEVLRRAPRYRYEALNYVERAKSRTLIEMLGSTIRVAPPPEVPSDLQSAEEDLLTQLQELDRCLQASPQDREHILPEYDRIWTQLEATWQEMADIAPEYVALRRGVPATFSDIRKLLADKARKPRERRVQVGTEMRRKQGAAASAIPSGSTQIFLLAADGTTLETTLGTTKDAGSYDEIVKQIATAGSTLRAEEEILRNITAFDKAWWRYLDDLINRAIEDNLPEFVRQGINTGKFICDQVLMHGTNEQLAAASAWRNRYLVAEIIKHIRDVKGEEDTEFAVSEALQADVEPTVTYLKLHGILSDTKEDSGYRRLLALIEANASWLDEHFFNELADVIQQAEQQEDQEFAWHCFVAGAAAGLAAWPGLPWPNRQFGAAEAFLDHFPEQRYRH
jgi:tetratricopeptide (TPR) repeat protein